MYIDACNAHDNTKLIQQHPVHRWDQVDPAMREHLALEPHRTAGKILNIITDIIKALWFNHRLQCVREMKISTSDTHTHTHTQFTCSASLNVMSVANAIASTFYKRGGGGGKLKCQYPLRWNIVRTTAHIKRDKTSRGDTEECSWTHFHY